MYKKLIICAGVLAVNCAVTSSIAVPLSNKKQLVNLKYSSFTEDEFLFILQNLIKFLEPGYLEESKNAKHLDMFSSFVDFVKDHDVYGNWFRKLGDKLMLSINKKKKTEYTKETITEEKIRRYLLKETISFYREKIKDSAKDAIKILEVYDSLSVVPNLLYIGEMDMYSLS